MKNSEIFESAFKKYDIRGLTPEVINETFSYNLGLVLAEKLHYKNIKSVIVGRDGRLSSKMISEYLTNGFTDNGINVINVGEVATPVVYFATHKCETNSAVIITASHNSSNYNGFKIVLDGRSIYGQEIIDLEKDILYINRIIYKKKGIVKNQELTNTYIKEICSNINISRPMSIMIDAGNGIAGPLAVSLFEKLGCNVHQLFCQVDGRFPNHNPDNSDPKNLEKIIDEIKKSNCELGLAFDGDGDRLIAITDDGKIIWPDQLMILFSKCLLKNNPGETVIYDVKCSRNLKNYIVKYGGIPIIWKSGHSLIKAKVKETNAIMAGEMSGHFFFRDWYGFDDGMYAGAKLLQILSNSNNASRALELLPKSISTPEIRIDTNNDNESRIIVQTIKEELIKTEEGVVNTIDGLRIDYEDAFGLIRVSNTKPAITMRFEANSFNRLLEIKRIFFDKIIKVAPWLKIDEEILR